MTARATPPPRLAELAPPKRKTLLESLKEQAAPEKLAGIYLAEIRKNDWRHDICGLRFANNPDYGDPRPTVWEPIVSRVPGVWITGPFFMACDHGCAHDQSTHAQYAHDYSGCLEEPREPWLFIPPDHGTAGRNWRRDVTRMCFEAIAASDGVYVWLDADDAHGALVEIGYAAGLGKPVMIDGPDPWNDQNKPDWFPFHLDQPNITRGLGINPYIGFAQFVAPFLRGTR